MELKNIIQDVIKIKEELKLNFSDDTLLDCSTRIYNSQNAIYRKNQEDKTYDNKKVDTGEKASVAQINLLYKLNATFDPDTITKHEAYNLIRKLKGIK